MDEATTHIPVLVNQAISLLNIQPGGIYIDATLGSGGHTLEILKRLGDTGKVYGLDADDRNLAIAKIRLHNFKNVHFIQGNFGDLAEIGSSIRSKEKKLSGIIFDLGLSSLHVDYPSRGFSFQREGPLDMRFDTRQKLTAADIVNTYSPEKLFFIFQNYGQEKFSRRIVSAILKERRQHKFETTLELAKVIERVTPPRHHSQIHPATRVFQALRIATNREIEVLECGLAGALHTLSQGGRIVVISYHSLEDRIVKNFFRNQKKSELLSILTKKPLTADDEEVRANRRSRSAKLRAAEKVSDT